MSFVCLSVPVIKALTSSTYIFFINCDQFHFLTLFLLRVTLVIGCGKDLPVSQTGVDSCRGPLYVCGLGLAEVVQSRPTLYRLLVLAGHLGGDAPE